MDKMYSVVREVRWFMLKLDLLDERTNPEWKYVELGNYVNRVRSKGWHLK